MANVEKHNSSIQLSAGEQMQYLQAQLFPVCTVTTAQGFLGSFLSKNLKTNQLEVKTDEKTLRSIARLKEPRDLFALPKERDHDCPQQAARWPSECQVLDERVYHIAYVPTLPEPYYQPTGHELRPRPVGEENGVVVYNYNPVSAVNYKIKEKIKSKTTESDDSDSDCSSGGSRSSTPIDRADTPDKACKRFSRMLRRSSSKSNDDDFNEEDFTPDKTFKGIPLKKEKLKIIQFPKAQKLIFNDEYCSDNDHQNYDLEIINSSILPINKNLNSAQFSRSSVGGSKFLMNVQSCCLNPDDNNCKDLEFESRFESGNLAKAVKITATYYELYLRPDLYTNRHRQWFYFRVTNTRKNVIYRFSIVNLVKSDSLYNEGMRPLMYSTINANTFTEGWKRCGDNICYYKNDDEISSDEDEENGSYTLSFNIQFPNDEDTVYFAHSYPYTYSDLQDYLMEIQRHPVKSKFCKLRLLCRSLAGNNIYYLTVTAPTVDEDSNKKKRAVIVSARVHPGETPSSWMMKGLLDFITGESLVAKRLRHKFIFKLIPMLNPDGVIVGNTRSSLTGKDLNRQYRTVIREAYPSIWYTKAMIKRLIEDCGIAMYCDMHAHSRKHNVFIYGCENKRSPDKKLSEQVYPLMLHKNVADKFSFESCKFRVQRNKEGTGRIVMWMLGITNSYTMEASFGGSTMGSRNATHFSTADYEHMGRAFCDTLLDFYDDNPVKVKKRESIFKRLKRIRRQERRQKKAAKLKKIAKEEKLRSKIIERLSKEGSSADEPLNIPLSDYSSDEGDTSSSSSENEDKFHSEMEGPCCQPSKMPTTTPEYLSSPNKEERKLKKCKSKFKSINIRHKRKKKIQRPVLDLPTTDPGSDLQFTTDDDEIYNERDGHASLPRIQRMLLHSDIRLRNQNYSEPKLFEKNPPELIITTAKHRSMEYQQPKTNAELDKKTPSPPITEFPPIGRNTRRTNSWHNLNNNIVSKFIKSHDSHNLSSVELKESLTMKLSLKKQIWNGVTPESSNGHRSRPLSWGIPQIFKKKNSSTKDDNQTLIMNCSQKLSEWQENETLNPTTPPSKNKVHIDLLVLNIPKKTATTNKASAIAQITTSKSEENIKVKKKKKATSKIPASKEILSRLIKSKSKSAPNQITSKDGTTYTTTPTITETSVTQANPKKYPNKMKTKLKAGGIVATAIQPSNKKKAGIAIKSMKSNEANQAESDSEKHISKKSKSKSRKKKQNF